MIELRLIHREIGSLRDENHKQNMEIASLKEFVQLQNKTINQHETTINELLNDDHRMIKSDHPVLPTGKSRRKRPAQLSPVSSTYSGEREGDNDPPNRIRQFYGPPANCSDLTRLGYTLNGFYLVKKPSNDEKITTLDIIHCAFQQEGTYNPSLVEKPVKPSPFNSPLSQNHVFLKNPMDEDVFFWFTTIRNNKDHFGVLTFDPSTINQGNGFDGKVGYFKAPKNGIYHFSYEMTDFLGIGRGNGTSVDFYINDAIVAHPLSSISRDRTSTSLQVTLKLKPGVTGFLLKATFL